MACKHDEKNLYNFGQTTAQESGVCGSSRPGAKQQRCYDENDKVTPEEVDEWVAYMKAAGVQAVVSMLSPSELATYEQPLQAAMEAAFGSDSYINVDDPAGPGGPAKIIEAIKAARSAGKKVLVHCWGGGGRTGWAQAAWLVVDGGMSPEQAAEAVTSYAAVQGLSRRVDVAKLKEFVAACQL